MSIAMTESAEERKFARVCDILDKHGRNPSKLVPILQEIQEQYRYLPEDVMTFVATGLGLPPANVYGVASFYSYFTFEPRGKYTIRLCDGTACHVRNSLPILTALKERLRLTGKQSTTPDMLFTLETVSCLGACGLAPVMVVNEDVHGLMTPEKAVELVDQIAKNEAQ